MNVTPELVLALGSLLIGVAGQFFRWNDNRFTAKKNEVELLRQEIRGYAWRLTRADRRIRALEDRNILLMEDLGTLREYAQSLRLRLMSLGSSDTPEMPQLKSDQLLRDRFLHAADDDERSEEPPDGNGEQP